MPGDIVSLRDEPFGLGGDKEALGIKENWFRGLNLKPKVNTLAQMV